jgi:RimJ/RimL family protein N-acetyltransferase
VPTHADAGTWNELFDDVEVMRFIGDGRVRDHAYYADLVQRQQQLARSTGLCLFSVVVEGQVVGFCGIQPWSQSWGPVGEPEIGWRLGRKSWGHGYAAQAARGAVARARDAQVPHLVAMVQEGNEASMTLARTLGMTSEAQLTSPDGAVVHQFGLVLPAA